MASWDSLLGSISLYSDSCESVIERLWRKKALPMDTNLATLMSDLHKSLVEEVSKDSFPVCSNYKQRAIDWLSEQFTEKIPEKDDANTGKSLSEALIFGSANP